MELHTTMIL